MWWLHISTQSWLKIWLWLLWRIIKSVYSNIISFKWKLKWRLWLCIWVIWVDFDSKQRFQITKKLLYSWNILYVDQHEAILSTFNFWRYLSNTKIPIYYTINVPHCITLYNLYRIMIRFYKKMDIFFKFFHRLQCRRLKQRFSEVKFI